MASGFRDGSNNVASVPRGELFNNFIIIICLNIETITG
jgi:hypothetical protein